MIGKISIAIGTLCFVFVLIPAALYGIFNAGVFALAAFGVLFLALPKYWVKIRKIRPLRNLLVILIAAGGFYIALMSAFMINRAYFSEPPESGKVAVIVLGSKIKGDQPSLMLRRRLDAARGYMQKNPSAICIVSGGQGPDEIMTEAQAMKNYLVANGIDSGKVFLEDKSGNTRQNLEFSAKLTPQDHQAVISTDGFHQLRASIYAKAAGLDAPYCMSTLTPWGLLPAYWLREIIGLPVAFLL